jgi:hypothetical protein
LRSRDKATAGGQIGGEHRDTAGELGRVGELGKLEVLGCRGPELGRRRIA